MEKTSILHLHEIASDFIKITDTVAREVYQLSGKGNKFDADKKAVEVMDRLLEQLPYKIRILIGEGEKDNSAMLDHHKKYGMKLKENIELDVVVDPLECTTNFSKGLPDSMSVMLIAKKDTIQPVPGTYMKQLLLPKEVRELGKIEILKQKSLSNKDKELIEKYILTEESNGKKNIKINKDLLEADPVEILKLVSIALDLSISDLTVVVQDRPRHQELIEKIRSAGAGIALIESGSISASAEIIIRKEGRYNLLMGTYGAPEGLIQAFMAKSTNSIFLGKIQPHNEKTEQEAENFQLISKILSEDEWIKEEGILTMSGIHSSTWLPGVRRIYKKNKKTDEKQYRYLVSTVVWTINNVQLFELEDGDLRKKEILFQ